MNKLVDICDPLTTHPLIQRIYVLLTSLSLSHKVIFYFGWPVISTSPGTYPWIKCDETNHLSTTFNPTEELEPQSLSAIAFSTMASLLEEPYSSQNMLAQLEPTSIPWSACNLPSRWHECPDLRYEFGTRSLPTPIWNPISIPSAVITATFTNYSQGSTYFHAPGSLLCGHSSSPRSRILVLADELVIISEFLFFLLAARHHM